MASISLHEREERLLCGGPSVKAMETAGQGAPISVVENEAEVRGCALMEEGRKAWAA